MNCDLGCLKFSYLTFQAWHHSRISPINKQKQKFIATQKIIANCVKTLRDQSSSTANFHICPKRLDRDRLGHDSRLKYVIKMSLHSCRLKRNQNICYFLINCKWFSGAWNFPSLSEPGFCVDSMRLGQDKMFRFRVSVFKLWLTQGCRRVVIRAD